jgi:proline iminopeptidase
MHGGLGLDHTYLSPGLDPLGERLRLVYYDHRGHGRSGRPPIESLTFERLCADADALRAHLGADQVAVLGHSYGGFIALEYALRYPRRLGALLLVDTAPAFDYLEEVTTLARDKGATDEVIAALAEPAVEDADLERTLKIIAPLYYHQFDAIRAERQLGRTIYSAAAGNRGDELLAAYDVTARLGEIVAPTLVLVGRDDFICPPPQARRLQEHIPGAELVVFERSGHFPFVEEPDEFFRSVRAWLDRQR